MGTPLRYNIPIPERTRVIWASAQAKALWEPRIRRINEAWAAVERASVGKFRKACRQSIAPDALPDFSVKAAESGLALLVLGQQATGGMYSSRSVELKPGMSFAYNIVLAEDIVAARTFAAASKAGDDAIMGDLLGYPPCCIKFFTQVWKNEQWMDTTWPMVRDLGTNAVDLQNTHPWNNILLRWLGVRMVPHLPCSFTCLGTHVFGTNFFGLFPQPERAWIEELLRASVEWNAMKGTAEIRLPILKIATTTDPLSEQVSVRIYGKPLEAEARGLSFPWKETSVAPSIHPMTFVKDTWTMNGFKSSEAMEKAHNIVKAFVSAMDLKEPWILDLGCGNGMLAKALADDNRGSAFGVEVDQARVSEAKKRIAIDNRSILDYMNDNVNDIHRFDISLIALQRFLEMSDEERWKTRKWLTRHVDHPIVYSYDSATFVEGVWATGLPLRKVEARAECTIGLLEDES